MIVYIFGNPDYAPDAVPPQLVPELSSQFQMIDFIVTDPNEDWEIVDPLIIIDTVKGISRVMEFTSLDHFTVSSRLSLHDFDLGMKLVWLDKLNKLPPFHIIGVPMGARKCDVVGEVVSMLQEVVNSN